MLIDVLNAMLIDQFSDCFLGLRVALDKHLLVVVLGCVSQVLIDFCDSVATNPFDTSKVFLRFIASTVYSMSLIDCICVHV